MAYYLKLLEHPANGGRVNGSNADEVVGLSGIPDPECGIGIRYAPLIPSKVLARRFLIKLQ